MFKTKSIESKKKVQKIKESMKMDRKHKEIKNIHSKDGSKYIF